MLPAAAVEAVGDRAQLVVVLGNVGVKQKKADAPHRDLPDPRVECAPVGKCERDLPGRAVRVAKHAQRKAVRVEDRVGLLLPAVRRDRLGEVAGAVEEADSDDRNTEIGGALQVVAGQDAQSAGVLRQCRGNAELGREVPDCGGRPLGERLVPARFGQVGVELVQPLVHLGDEALIRRKLVKPGRIDLAQ